MSFPSTPTSSRGCTGHALKDIHCERLANAKLERAELIIAQGVLRVGPGKTGPDTKGNQQRDEA
jgi:hypothetical protein